jgi:hypothetical protein
MSRDVWAVVSDLHAGSTLGLCPPEGVLLDDGGRYMPSNAHVHLWECWLDYWSRVEALVRPGDRLYVALNGDVVEGSHHRSVQIVTENLPATQHEIAMGCLAPALALRPAGIVLIRGTEAHVGSSAAYEERLARDLDCIQEPSTGAYSWWHFQAESNGVLLDFAHHGNVGKLPWTRQNPTNSLAARIFMASAKSGRRHPDLAIRSHAHQGADSYDIQPVRVVQTRAWQLSTAFVHKIAAGSVPEIGGLVVTCENGTYDLQKVEYDWKRIEPWKPKGPGKSTSPKPSSSKRTSAR